MKKYLKLAQISLLIITFGLGMASCKKEKDEGRLPTISFKTGAGYVSKDTTIGMNTAVTMGVDAAKAEKKDVLTKLTIVRNYDNGADTILATDNLTGTQGDTYSRDFTTTTRSVAGKEKYTFTVVNRDGLINNATLTITVQ